MRGFHRQFPFRTTYALTVVVLAATLFGESCLCGGESEPDSDSLVQQALQAELDGDPAQRATCLTNALRQDPDDSAARWLSGFIKHENRWLPIETSASLHSSNPALFQYGLLRNRHAGHLAGEIALARWCRMNDLEDREQLHWSNVLRIDSTNAEARTRLKLRAFGGQWVTTDQVEAFKQAAKDYRCAEALWGPKLNRLRRRIKAAPSDQKSQAWEALAAIDDPDAVPSMEKLAHRVDPELQIHLIKTIGSIQEQVSSDALVRLSLHSKDAEARQAAARKLAEHPLHAYAPQYLNRLESPIEYVSSLNAIGDQVISHTHLRQQRADDAINLMQSTDAGLTVQDPSIRSTSTYRRIVAREVRLHRQKIAATERAAKYKNAQIKLANHRIFTALRTATGEQMDDVPKLWWDWWKRYNEYHVAEHQPEYYLTNTAYRRRTLRLPRPRPRRCECFPAGTLVHTETGKRRIESIQPGDKVLSQDLSTGELSYRLVAQTSIRPPSETMQITVAGEQITATVGHPFWVVGKGWTMAKELNPGDRLWGIDGSTPIDVIEAGVNSEAHNLFVDQTHSYFVGQQGFLVHDNLIRGALRIPLPGWKAND